MAIPAPEQWQLVNPNFESGDTDGWTDYIEGSGAYAVTSENSYSGSYSVKWQSTSGISHLQLRNQALGVVVKNQQVTVTCAIKMDDTGSSANRGAVRLYWRDKNKQLLADDITFIEGNVVHGNSNAWFLSTVTGRAPEGAVYCQAVVWLQANTSGAIYADAFTWDYTYDNTAVLTNPAVDDVFAPGETITLSVNSFTGSKNNTATKATYYIYRVEGSDPADYPLVKTVKSTKGTTGYTTLTDEDSYLVKADVEFTDGTYITTSGNPFDIVEPVLLTREYNASNAQTFLVGRNLSDIASSMPPTALVTGAEIVVDYKADVIGRTKDAGVDVESTDSTDPASIFSILTGGVIEVALFSVNNNTYTQVGSSMSANVSFDRTGYTLGEQLLSEKKLYSYWEDTTHTQTIGGEESIFSLANVDGATFQQYALGIRFYPTTGSKPINLDAGDASVRFMLNRWKVRVYFDAGSVEYYFASPDKSMVIKGELVSSNVDKGKFATNDAEGSLQLRPNLEVMDGDQSWIGEGWSVHSNYPPDDSNKIAMVDSRSAADEVGMGYNGLPGYWEVEDNRSRYEFITANFYGDPNWDSIYGVSGVDRAFSYNGEEFYKIQTQPDIDKDMPRHVANHHLHLALGYKEGRVDMSVVGEPYNYDGVDGASSWAFGDRVVGLTALSGSLLGVFGNKSISGLSGTTVDNFATQTISAKVGAIEYSITDMGFPIYANNYGIYTLSQTNQYGDYVGSPLSQNVSPWLRPRLVRKTTSNKEVVCAWPVRAKNQYRLAFADGYVLTMTMNFGSQDAPTFSKQKYFIESNVEVEDMFASKAIVPAAVSSELDDSGEERIHIANKQTKYLESEDIPVPPPEPTTITVRTGTGTVFKYDDNTNNVEFIDVGVFGEPIYDHDGYEPVLGKPVNNEYITYLNTSLKPIPEEDSSFPMDVTVTHVVADVEDVGDSVEQVTVRLPISITNIDSVVVDGADVVLDNYGSRYLVFDVPLDTPLYKGGEDQIVVMPVSKTITMTGEGLETRVLNFAINFKYRLLDGTPATFYMTAGKGYLAFSINVQDHDSSQIDISWGDGTHTTVPAETSNAAIEHTYEDDGEYPVELRIAVPRYYKQGTNNTGIKVHGNALLSVDDWSESYKLQGINSLINEGGISFYSREYNIKWQIGYTLSPRQEQHLTTNLTTVPDYLPPGQGSLVDMFQNCTGLDVDFSSWDFSKIKHMGGFMQNCGSYEYPVGDWDVSNVEYVSSIFSGIMYKTECAFIGAENWDVGNIKSMNYMFAGNKTFNAPIGNWDVSGVTSFAGMFAGCESFNQDLSGWDVSNGTDFVSMFSGCTSFNHPVTTWNLSNVVDTGEFVNEGVVFMFEGCSSFNQPLDFLNGIKGRLNHMFEGCSSLDQPLEGIDFSGVTSMDSMFLYCWELNSSVADIDVSNVTDMSNMFALCYKFNQPLTGWDTSNVKHMSTMFMYCRDFNQDLSNLDVSNVESMASMFSAAETFNGNITTWRPSKVTDMNYMFEDAAVFNQDLSNWHVPLVPEEPSHFADGAVSWVLPRPTWGVE